MPEPPPFWCGRSCRRTSMAAHWSSRVLCWRWSSIGVGRCERSAARSSFTSAASALAPGVVAGSRRARPLACPGSSCTAYVVRSPANLVGSGVPERVAMNATGHKTRSALDRYNVVSTSDLSDAAGRLADYLDDLRTTWN